MSLRSITPLFALLFLAFPHAGVLAGENEWREVRTAEHREEIETWRRNVDDNPLDAFMGRVEVPYGMDVVLAVLGDIDNFPEWVFQCDETEFYPDDWGPDVVRIVIEGIWPVSDRDAVVRSTFEQEPETLAITIRSRAEEGIVEEKRSFVRIPELDNTFLLEPMEDGWTRITFRTFVDPGGRIPSWLANFVATRAPLTTLRDMRKRMELEQYHDVELDAMPMLPGMEDMKLP